MRVTMTLNGLEPLMRRLRGLEPRVRKKVLRKAVRAAANPIAKAIRANAPVRYGVLKRSIRTKIRTYRESVVAVSGPQRMKDRTTGANPANYAMLVERGTRPHVIPRMVFTLSNGQTVVRQNVVHPGASANPFITRASRATRSAAIQAFARKAAVEIYREARAS